MDQHFISLFHMLEKTNVKRYIASNFSETPLVRPAFCNRNVAYQEGWSLIRGRNHTLMLRFTFSSDLLRWVDLSSEWPYKMGSTVLPNFMFWN